METTGALNRSPAGTAICKLPLTTRAFYTLLVLCGVLTGCTPAESPTDDLPKETAAPADTPRSVNSSPTFTFLASPSPTGTPSFFEITTPTGTASPPPTPSPLPTSSPLSCWNLGGQITQHTLRTPISPLPWEFRVYTPPCYEQQPDRRYPVLILIHGSSFNDDQWDRLGADETADNLIAKNEIPPFLILMPRDRLWTDEPRDDPFGEALINYLIPWMDENYRTLPARAYRAIGGLSRGASWAVHLGLSHWELFGAIGGHSLPVFVTDPPRINRWLNEIPTEEMPRFFLDIGEKDYLLEHALWFENLLTQKNIPHEWYLYTGRHEEAYWASHIEQYLRWYVETWSHLQ